MENKSKAKPFKVVHGEPDREFEIKDNGDVIMTESVTNVFHFHGRQFLTFMRSFEQAREELEEQITDEYKDKVQQEIEKVGRQQDNMKGMKEKVEKKLREQYKKDMRKKRVEQLKELIENPNKNNRNIIQAIWQQLDKEGKKQLDKKEKKKIKKEINKLKR